ncbi:MAG: hypothetical protein AAGD11_12735 [Planctomycetota bacterium]
MGHNVLAQLALLGYPAAVLVLFALLPLRRAILTAMVGGWLFLPTIKLPVVGIPDYDKIVATNCAVALGCIIFAGRELLALRPKWIDIPMLLWCIAPSLSSLSNDLGYYDAGSVGVRQVLTWLVPYCIGRAFFKDSQSMRDLAIAFVVGGVAYIPFCLLEVRLSPQLNYWVYGFHQNQFWRNMRLDGFRPVVFMNNGLMVGMWMATSTVISFWLWLSGERKLLGVPYPAIFGALLVVTVLCKALYAIMLMLLALALLLVARYGKTLVPAMLLFLAVPGYMAVRGLQILPAETIVQQAKTVFGSDRAQSLGARLSQEDFMIKHAMERPVFGWGGYRRSWPIDTYTGEFQIRGLDGLWTIMIGQNGLFGVGCVFATLLAPIGYVLFRRQNRTWGDSQRAAYEVLSISLLIFTCDCLLNGMFNPLFIVIAGAISQPLRDATAEAYDVAPTEFGRANSVQRNLKRINGSYSSTPIAPYDA